MELGTGMNLHVPKLDESSLKITAACLHMYCNRNLILTRPSWRWHNGTIK